jgi:hypothetical protein
MTHPTFYANAAPDDVFDLTSGEAYLEAKMYLNPKAGEDGYCCELHLGYLSNDWAPRARSWPIKHFVDSVAAQDWVRFIAVENKVSHVFVPQQRKSGS